MTMEKEINRMGKAKNTEQNQSELAIFMKEARENFLAAGKAKPGWFRNMLKILFS
jgi:hypothetical protein